MQSVNFEEVIDQILVHDARYAREAYHFLREALDHTQRRVHKNNRVRRSPDGRHVTGQQLTEGIREYALDTFGPMAGFTLESWGIRCCEDLGEIVFNLVDHGRGMFGKTDQDSRDDFKGGYDFDVAFRQPFLPSRRLRRSSRAIRQA